MPETVQYVYDAAPAIIQGQREYQEDTLAVDFTAGAGMGFIVLADGMGGHSAGDVASKIVVTEIFSELKMRADDAEQLESDIGKILHAAVSGANECIGRMASESPRMQGMGATLVAPIVIDNRLYWISVGDSPLYMFRGNRLFRLNEEHSVKRRMAQLVDRGEMAREVADEHPDRGCLTSVLIGSTIPEIDCRDTPVELRHDDIVIAASDGLQFISDLEIARIVYESRTLPSAEISARLVKRITDLNDPDQDNLSLCVLKVQERSRLACAAADIAAPAPVAEVQSTRTSMLARVNGKTTIWTRNTFQGRELR
ncbi:Serine/threonine protein phosphatase PrpC [Roseovarius azorensis]|uniref:Serine/threonine protein phosphatase PrpC n=1 Tax=Roseovarius azorensis TaxID=1287727 RepID=A0A1H7U0G7_9RHOB|nr:protein phosphatase 2C domain-containing protein [Roseovarius azorensis]SEL90294.1 Serine/threonine protein phosphatase PrpC [Roseovarius azorensis]